MFISIICTAILSGFFAPAAGPAAAAGENFPARLDTYLTRIVPFGFSGAVLVAREGRVLLEKGYGFAIRSGNVPNTTETVFSTGSLTKQFTAAAILTLEMDGILDTGDLLSRHVGGVPPDKDGITLHHLLTHTAGLPGASGPDYAVAERDGTVQRILAQPLEFEPGTRMAYSNCGYTLLAAVVEIVSGEPYEQYLRRRLFQPAGMRGTGYRAPDWSGRTVAHWYNGDTDNGRPLDKPYPYWNLLGNGGILTTTGDMLRWYRALRGGDVLSPAAKKKMWTPYVNDYGYGWDVLETDDGDTLIRHDGGSRLGSSAVMRWLVEADLLVVVFCNQSYRGEAMFEVIEENIEAFRKGEPPGIPEETAWPVDPSGLAAYAGTYRIDGGGEVEATVTNEALLLRAADQAAIDALFFPGDAAGRDHGGLNERARALVEGALDGDDAPFAGEFADPDRAARFERMLAREMRWMEKASGARIERVEIAGTVPTPFAGVVGTTVELLSEAGRCGRMSLLWRDGRLVGLDQRAYDPAVPFVPAARGDGFAGYHLAWGKSYRVEFRHGGHGGPPGFRVGRLAAEKID